MKPKSIFDPVLIIGVFLIAFYGWNWLPAAVGLPELSPFWKIAGFYVWWAAPSLLTIGFRYGFRNIPGEIGIDQGFLTGLAFSVIVAAPMFISSALAGRISEDMSPGSLFHETFLAGFMEEYLFRGFLFGLLFRRCGWGFIPAGVSGALIFGLGHVYQGTTFAQTLGVFLVTAMGALWFAWLYIEWDGNLWIPIFLHSFMNLSWGLFEMSDNALGGWYVNLFRAITIGLSIVITIRYYKNRGLRIRRHTLFYGFQSTAPERK